MPPRTFLPTTWPVVGLSLLLMLTCIIGIVYINRLQAELGDSFLKDSARLQTAQQAQIHLREYRAHTIVQAAGLTEERRLQVTQARRLFLTSLNTLDTLAVAVDDRADLAELRAGWEQYEVELAEDFLKEPVFHTVEALSVWADSHRVRALLIPCGRLVERSQARMSEVTLRSEQQTRWTGRFLLVAGLIGPLAGLIGGYLTAKSLARRFEEQDRQLARANQLAAVGNLAAGVAHEIRNPMTGIKMMVESAIRPTCPSPLTEADLTLIRDEITRLERTVQGLLDYSKPAPSVRITQDVWPIIARAVEIVATQARRAGVTVECISPLRPLFARIDPDQFIALLTNLLLNALEATPQGGTVTVEASGSTRDAVLVTVSDTGPGLTSEVSATLFTPFATNKRTGTGLGLVVARRIAVDHGGSLAAGNRPKGGACFTLTLPAGETADAEVVDR